MQVLAQQTSLDQNLTGSDIKNAFQKSGLFLEASLASGSVSPASGVPDLKAALIVLRQTLVVVARPSRRGCNSPAAPATAAAAVAVPAAPAAAIRRSAMPPLPQLAAASPTLAPSLVSATSKRSEILLPQVRAPAADDSVQPRQRRPGSCSRKRCSMPGLAR